MMPMSRSPLITSSAPTSCSAISVAASRSVHCGGTVTGRFPETFSYQHCHFSWFMIFGLGSAFFT